MDSVDMARRRWKGVAKAERSQAMRDAVNARWEKWREENPKKAAASEQRRKRRKKA